MVDLNSVNPAATDLRGNPRINGSVVDMGVFENSDYSVITHSTGSGSGSIRSHRYPPRPIATKKQLSP